MLEEGLASTDRSHALDVCLLYLNVVRATVNHTILFVYHMHSAVPRKDKSIVCRFISFVADKLHLLVLLGGSTLAHKEYEYVYDNNRLPGRS